MLANGESIEKTVKLKRAQGECLGTCLLYTSTSPWLIAFRIIFTIALVWCILVIFHNSLETSSISSARSHEVMQKINAILAHLNIDVYKRQA